MTPFDNNKGFSLIELMIAVVISAILAAVAWPSYKSHIEKSRNAEVQNTLLNIVALQTQYFTENRKYAKNLTGTTDSLDIPLVKDPIDNNPAAPRLVTPTKLHIIELTTDVQATTYQLVSKPYKGSALNNSGTQYYVDQTGLKKSHHGDGSTLLNFDAVPADFDSSGWK